MNKREKREVFKQVMNMYKGVREINKDSYICGKGIRRYMVGKDITANHFSIITKGDMEEIKNKFNSVVTLEGDTILYDKENNISIKIIPMGIKEFMDSSSFRINKVALTDRNLISNEDMKAINYDFRNANARLSREINNKNILDEALELRYESWYINYDDTDFLKGVIKEIDKKDLILLLSKAIELKSRNQIGFLCNLNLFGAISDKLNRSNDSILDSIKNTWDTYSYLLGLKENTKAIILATAKIMNKIDESISIQEITGIDKDLLEGFEHYLKTNENPYEKIDTNKYKFIESSKWLFDYYNKNIL